MRVVLTHFLRRFVPAAAAAILILGASPSPQPASRARTLVVADMDTGAEACVDFYQYADGGWLQKNPIPSDRPRWGTFDELRQRNQEDLRAILERLAADKSAPAGSEERKLGDFYGACMDEAAIETNGLAPIAPELARIDAIKDVPGLRAEISRLQPMGADVLFAFGSEEDRKDSTMVVAAALQAGIGLPERDYYLKKDEKSVQLRDQYVAHVTKMLELSGEKPEAAAADAKAILGLETKLAEASQSNVDIRDPDKTYHPLAAADVAKANPNLEWVRYFREQGVPASITVNVWQPDFFKAADGLLKSVPLATWKTYLRWRLLSSAAPSLPKRFVDENFAFFSKTLSGVPELQPRWKRCVSATDAAMGMALGKIYVQTHFPPDAKRRADEMVQNLLAALRDDVQTLDWMSEATKKAAMAKIATFDTRIGYPAKWRDYSSLAITRASHGANVLAATSTSGSATSRRSESLSTGRTGG